MLHITTISQHVSPSNQDKSPFRVNTQITLYDLLGNSLLAGNLAKGISVYTLNVSHLRAGVYILQVRQQDEVLITEKVIIK